MPRYDFVCDCGKKKEIVRPVKDSAKAVKCSCGSKMYQDYSEHIRPGTCRDIHKGYCYAFGKNFDSNSQKKNYIERYNRERGEKVECIG